MADYKYVAVNSDSHINMINVFEKNNVHAPWFADCCGHFNYKVNKICAGAIFDKLLPILQKTVDDRRLVTKDNDLVSSIYINRYFADFKPQKYNKIGAIVMNGDPFTAGHRYLIQEALKSVDFLIIFVIENGEFLFTFEERYSMLCGGVEDLRNVMVVPSGRYIVIKEPMSEIWNHVQKIENMLVLFAQAIAKRLNITHCFVGEEIEDSTANKYNKKMKKILPLYGISVIEIPRKRHGKNIISSTYVQKCIEMGNECLLDEILPDSTKQMLHN